MTALIQWLDADESRAVFNAQRTPSVQSGDVGAARILPDLIVPADCPVELFPQLSQAMAAYPNLPWHELSVWSGELAEPELVAAKEANKPTEGET
jgi:hypothetical protein